MLTLRRLHSRQFLAAALAAAVVLGVLIAVPIYLTARADAKTAKRLSSIALCLLAYERDHGTLPPAYLCDTHGKPIHSWRLLLLPELGYSEIFDRYDFAEPWDGDHNRNLLSQIPIEYQSPDAPTGYTDIVAVVGKDTAWPAPLSKSLHDVNAATLIVLVRAKECRPWMAPDDLSYDAVISATRTPEALRSKLGYEFYCVTADATVHRLCPDVTREELQRLLTIGGKRPAPLKRDVLSW